MLFIVKLYIWTIRIVYKYTKIRIRGLGKIQTLLKKDTVLYFKGKKLYFKSGIEGSYDNLLIGKSNEPETHLLFEKIIPFINDEVNFIDVGASIGEMIIGNLRFNNIKNLIAFEARPDCVTALNKSKELNNEERITVYNKLVSNTNGHTEMYFNAGGTSSGIYQTSTNSIEEEREKTIIESVKLDDILPKELTNTIILIDVEGAEPLVLEGCQKFIQDNNPLIIFEYNNTSKKYFNLDDIHTIIGDKYDFFRIKGDASFDKDFSNSWNVAAVPQGTIFEKILIS